MDKEIILLKELQKGSYWAFDNLYKKYIHLLYGFIFDLTRSHEQTKELVQETFIKVWINRKQINPELSFKAWLYKIAQNLLLNQIKKQWQTPLFENYLDHTSNEFLSIETQYEKFDFDHFIIALEKAKTKLSPRQREIFELIKDEGVSIEKIHKDLNLSEQAVYNYLSQCMKILRSELSTFKKIFFLFFL